MKALPDARLEAQSEKQVALLFVVCPLAFCYHHWRRCSNASLGLISPDLGITQDAQSVITELQHSVSLVFGALLFTPIIWGEEFGWRSYLPIRLFNNDKPLIASIVHGLVWGVLALSCSSCRFPVQPEWASKYHTFPLYTPYGYR